MWHYCCCHKVLTVMLYFAVYKIPQIETSVSVSAIVEWEQCAPHNQCNVAREAAERACSWRAQGAPLRSSRGPSPEEGNFLRHSSQGDNRALSLAQGEGESPPGKTMFWMRGRKFRKTWKILSEHEWLLRQVLKKNDPSKFWNSELFFRLWEEYTVPVQSKTTTHEGRTPKLLVPGQVWVSGSFRLGLQPWLLSPGLAGLKVPEPRHPAISIHDVSGAVGPKGPDPICNHLFL